MPITASKIPFTETNINRVPQSSGVYGLYDQSYNTIYYGMSESDIRGRLLAHFNGKSGTCQKNAVYISWELTKDAVQKEKDLIAEHKRQNNGKLPKCNEVHP